MINEMSFFLIKRLINIKYDFYYLLLKTNMYLPAYKESIITYLNVTYVRSVADIGSLNWSFFRNPTLTSTYQEVNNFN